MNGLESLLAAVVLKVMMEGIRTGTGTKMEGESSKFEMVESIAVMEYLRSLILDAK